METPWPGGQNGHPNSGWDGNPQPEQQEQQEPPPGSFGRPFTLVEALPYTPFSSIAPFDSSVLPSPSIGSALPAPPVTDLIPDADFGRLNQEFAIQNSTKFSQNALLQVQRLLERGNIPEFKFKAGPRPESSSNPSRTTAVATTLLAFSKMVYDQTSIPFRYPTPETPTSTPGDHKDVIITPVPTKQKLPVAQPPVPVKVEPSAAPVNRQVTTQVPVTPAHNKSASSQKARLEIVLPTKKELEQLASVRKSTPKTTTGPPTPAISTSAIPLPQQPGRPATKSPKPNPSVQPAQPVRPVQPIQPVQPVQPIQPAQAVAASIEVAAKRPESQPPQSSHKPVIAIELPKAAVFSKSESMVVADEPDEPSSLSLKKRKAEDLDGEDIYGESLDLRQRADAALNELRIFLQHAFQAEHAALAQHGNDMAFLIAENEATLTAAAQSKAQILVGKTISLNCYRKVPLDDLLRLLSLSEGALKWADTADVKVDETWSTADAEQWLQQLPYLEIAIRAARTSLRMMCGGRQDKQLYSEDTIEQCLNLFKRIVDGVVIPIAELRNASATSQLFRTLSQNKKRIVSLFNDCQKLFAMLSTLISSIDTSDTVSNTLEFTASRLIFMETANAEKDSVIDTQKFDGLRLVAMDMLSQIFLLNPEQRSGIFREILSSLEKLPLGKRARTFKLMDGTSIQPVSALIMRLVQTSAGKVDDSRGGGRSSTLHAGENGTEGVLGHPKKSFTIRDESHGAAEHSTAIQELDGVVTPLIETATKSASDVVSFIVNRALKSTKSGDTPYRNLLDLFVEDFTVCLDNPDWPASELLLRLLMRMMFQLVENDKSSVTAKNLALELLGTMGAAISKLRGHVRKSTSLLDTQDNDGLALFLSDLAASALELKSRPEHMVTWTGPYRATVEFLETRFSEDPHLASAISFIISDWGHKICTCYDGYQDDAAERDEELGRLAYRLREMIHDRQWLSNEYSFKEVSPSYAKLSYSITLLRSQLCEAFNTILNILLNSMASDQPTVRSKSLKSVNQVLETDPSILDGDSVVVQLILRCSNDSSTQVRDSALGLIGKCITMRPALEEQMTPTVVDRFSDAGPGVRKRAMKLAKDIYLRNSNRALRSTIANGLLHRVQDPEESVRDLARQVIEEIWFAPYHNSETSAVSQISLAEHVSLMVQTVKRGNVTNVLDKVLQSLLAPTSKAAQVSLEVCTKLVASMFDLVDNPESDDSSGPSGRDVLQVLMIFAKAEASLFTFEQLRLLKPHITSIVSSEDLAVSRAVVVIYRRVLPQLSSAHAPFLADVRKELMPAVSKVTRALLDDIMACLWIISTLLESSEHLARLVLSSLKAIFGLRIKSQTQPLDERSIRQFDRYSLIVGMAGKHCDLNSHLDTFKASFPKWNGSTVSKLMVDTVVPFAAPSRPLDVRKAALDAVGLVCQSAPRNYESANIYTTFQTVFDEQVSVLESMVLRSFKEFLLTEEKRSEQAAEAPTINGGKSEKKRELTVIGGTSYDDVASGTTQRFLKQIIRIATSTQDDHAFLAVEVLASINRQGLVHPKETGVTFITLETSSNARISELAFLEHKALHAKHETVIEREYVKAVQSAFAYQRDIVKEPRGATENTFVPKLHLLMEVLKISKSKNRQRFLEKFCGQLDFDISKLEMTEEVPPHVQYSRFILENIAFFEYVTVGEVHCIVTAMEKLVSSTGANIAQVIEADVFQVRMDMIDSVHPDPLGNMDPSQPIQPSLPNIELGKLRRLTAGSMVLLALWEVRTYLRKLYNLGTTSRRESKTKLQAKDLSKAPIKVQGMTGDKLWEEIGTIMTALTSRERMMETCKGLVELMNVDKEFLVQDEDEDMMNGEEGETPSADENEDGGEPSQPRRGRKRKSDSQGTPNGRKKRARSSSQGPRKRGRPKKVSLDAQMQDADHDGADWF
ncbi:protein rad9 [Podospora australis]|uniref:Sister chromatid cohesion protein n=1 Tax=Podospora australis TaxID=1536484 RepID=A0AAN6X4T9_9PEZI|nr:protein rad9 [Podospora australis]